MRFTGTVHFTEPMSMQHLLSLLDPDYEPRLFEPTILSVNGLYLDLEDEFQLEYKSGVSLGKKFETLAERGWLEYDDEFEEPIAFGPTDRSKNIAWAELLETEAEYKLMCARKLRIAT